MLKKTVAGICAALAVGGALISTSCRTKFDARDPTGEMFPAVVGTSLSGATVAIPGDFHGKPVVLLVGYLQETQFDIDRWLLGLSEMKTDVAVREVPTLPGLAPRVFSGFIDGGMRRGIPEADWGSVVTVYGDAAKIAEFTGNREGLPGRVLLLDADGKVAYFHDRGYSVGSLMRLRETLAGFATGSRAGPMVPSAANDDPWQSAVH
ncbi:MAG: hypothetical protein K8T90_22040 [Planctomycetes bacterium]|nr:hypothetical protein [Planctomycetota bacterium]